MPCGFFAFSNPGPDRMLSNWFLAAEKGDYLIDQWYAGCAAYWSSRTERHTYFWHHYLFSELYDRDPKFRARWDAAPKIPARIPLHFAPWAEKLMGPLSPTDRELIESAAMPMLKLNRRIDPEGCGASSAYRFLLDRAS